MNHQSHDDHDGAGCQQAEGGTPRGARPANRGRVEGAIHPRRQVGGNVALDRLVVRAQPLADRVAHGSTSSARRSASNAALRCSWALCSLDLTVPSRIPV